MEEWKSRVKIAGVYAFGYLLFFGGLVGWRDQHLYLLLLVVALIVAHRFSFYLLLALSGLLGWTMLFDAMTILPNYEVNSVHIKDLYDLEVSLFGVQEHLPNGELGGKISLCEWVVTKYNDFLSFTLGFSYLLWVPGPAAYGIYLIFGQRRSKIGFFTNAYFLTNVIGVMFYYLIPAAPPWYYLSHGPEVDLSISGSAAGLAEFDRIVGIDIFTSIYENNSNVFGAIPSLHAAYPLLCLLVAQRNRHTGWAIFFALMSVGTWLAAVYTQHHYVIDVLCGIICAVVAYYLMIYFSTTSWWQRIERWYNIQLHVDQKATA